MRPTLKTHTHTNRYNGMFRDEVRDMLPKLEKTVEEVGAKLASSLEKELFEEIVQDANSQAKSLCSKLESSANVAISTDTDFGWRNSEDTRWSMLKRAWRSRKSAVRPLVVVNHPLKKHMGLNFGHDEYDTVTVTSVKTDCPSYAHGCRAMWNLCELGGIETRTFHDARGALSKIDHSASTFELKFAPSVSHYYYSLENTPTTAPTHVHTQHTQVPLPFDDCWSQILFDRGTGIVSRDVTDDFAGPRIAFGDSVMTSGVHCFNVTLIDPGT